MRQAPTRRDDLAQETAGLTTLRSKVIPALKLLLAAEVAYSLVAMIAVATDASAHRAASLFLVGCPFGLTLLVFAAINGIERGLWQRTAEISELRTEQSFAQQRRRAQQAQLAEQQRLARRGHVLYRLFNHDGALLYVGITNDAARRFRQHAETKPWWAEVTNTTAEYLASRAELEAMERLASVREHPKYNSIYNRVGTS